MGSWSPQTSSLSSYKLFSLIDEDQGFFPVVSSQPGVGADRLPAPKSTHLQLIQGQSSAPAIKDQLKNRFLARAWWVSVR